jgi:hypothetical protein
VKVVGVKGRPATIVAVGTGVGLGGTGVAVDGTGVVVAAGAAATGEDVASTAAGWMSCVAVASGAVLSEDPLQAMSNAETHSVKAGLNMAGMLLQRASDKIGAL